MKYDAALYPKEVIGMKEQKPTKWEWFFVNLVGVCSVIGAITMVCLVASVFLRLLGCE